MKASIIKVKELLGKDNLNIPEYQRPYKWGIKNVNQLIDDIIEFKDKSSYRLGTLVLHKEKENGRLNIVDGQQRTITLSLILEAIKEKNIGMYKDIKNSLLNFEFNNRISQYNIQNNYKEIKRRVRDFDENIIKFFLDECELVEVVLKDISEAFQFFDSQNARGKDLEPHDLLKAYHLREMKKLEEEEKTDAIKKWEEVDESKMSKLFGNYLYRIHNWSRGNSARYFTKGDIDAFKGIDLSGELLPYEIPYNYLLKSVNLNNSNYKKFAGMKKVSYPFQLDQVIINGKNFFEMIAHYSNIRKLICDDCGKVLNISVLMKGNEIIELLNGYDEKDRTGDKYVRNLFDCALIYYYDKFGEKDIKKVIEKIFVWAYILRLERHSVQLASVDNYALGLEDENPKLFKIIREAKSTKEIINLELKNIKVSEIKDTKNKEMKNNGIKEKFQQLGYLEEGNNE